MGPIGYPETSVKNYHLPRYENYKQVIMKWWVDSAVPTNIPKEQTDLEELCSSGLDRGCTNLKFCVFGVFCRSSERNVLHVTLLAPRILIGGS